MAATKSDPRTINKGSKNLMPKKEDIGILIRESNPKKIFKRLFKGLTKKIEAIKEKIDENSAIKMFSII